MFGGNGGCGPPMAACAESVLTALVCGLESTLLIPGVGPQLEVPDAVSRDDNDDGGGKDGGGGSRLCGPGAMPAMAYGMRFWNVELSSDAGKRADDKDDKDDKDDRVISGPEADVDALLMFDGVDDEDVDEL